MALALGCIGDDYTGSSDLANTLTRNGLRTLQLIGVPSAEVALPEVDAIVIALKIRSVAAADAVKSARVADAWLRARGVSHVLYKICSTFDSTDAGNIGPVMDSLRADRKQELTLVTPAFPETGRTVYKGNLFVDDVPLNESSLKDHPLTPMRDANLVRVLGRQSRVRVGLIDLQTVAQGEPRLREAIGALAASGVGVAVVDAVFPTDLETIGAVALEMGLSVGASGLGLGLARSLVRGGRVGASNGSSSLGAPVGGAAACLAGSCSKATLEQIEKARAVMPVLLLDVDAVVGGRAGAEAEMAVSWAQERLELGSVLIASSASAEQVAKLQARYGRDTTGKAIEECMATIAADLVARGVRRLIVAGGETAGAVVDRLGLPGFLVGPEIAAGVPALRTIGGAGRDMALALKSGNFGGPDFFSDALAILK
ncbi:MAG: 3-oxo-tetronate kinase [Roseiarcus sp.]|jgi:uncharacterized protein YgbK (DUF1537 family)|uniref:3-oxo-tetronate kinase n=1 Tax=Roseiarcus sp. TaxID=1969460 RepID=UPI003C2776AA